jgi:hypothetical protein
MTANPSDPSSLHGVLFNAATPQELQNAAPIDTLADRIRSNRSLRLLLHIALPVALSLVLHALLIAAMTFCSAFVARTMTPPLATDFGAPPGFSLESIAPGWNNDQLSFENSECH